MKTEALKKFPKFIFLSQLNAIFFVIIEFILYDLYSTRYILPSIVVISLLSLILVTYKDPGTIKREKQNKYVNEIDFYDDDIQVKTDIPFKREILISGDIFLETYCISCNIFQSKNISHCYKCNSCIFRRDHHCYWFKNCIGQKNSIYFISFLITSACLTINLLYYLINNLDSTSETDFYFYLTLLVFESLKLLAIVLLLVYNISLKLLNLTSIEFVKRETMISNIFSSLFKIFDNNEIECENYRELF